MKKMEGKNIFAWRRVLALLLAVAMIFTLTPVNTWASAGSGVAADLEKVQEEKEEKKEEKKSEEPKKEETQKEEPQKEETQKQEPQKEEPQKEETQKQEPQKEETQKEETQKQEPQKEETQKQETAAPETPAEEKPTEAVTPAETEKQTEAQTEAPQPATQENKETEATKAEEKKEAETKAEKKEEKEILPAEKEEPKKEKEEKKKAQGDTINATVTISGTGEQILNAQVKVKVKIGSAEQTSEPDGNSTYSTLTFNNVKVGDDISVTLTPDSNTVEGTTYDFGYTIYADGGKVPESGNIEIKLRVKDYGKVTVPSYDHGTLKIGDKELTSGSTITTYEINQKITVEAVPDTNYVVGNSAYGDDHKIEYTVGADTKIADPEFKLKEYDVQVNIEGSGSVEIDGTTFTQSGTKKIKHGSYTATFTPADHWCVTKIDSGTETDPVSTSEAKTKSISVTGEGVTVSVKFSKCQYTVNVTLEDSDKLNIKPKDVTGFVTDTFASSGSGIYTGKVEYGSNAKIPVTVKGHYEITSVKVGNDEKITDPVKNKYDVELAAVDADKNITVSCSSTSYTVNFYDPLATTSPAPVTASIDGKTGTTKYNAISQFTTAPTAAGYTFKGWKLVDSGTTEVKTNDTATTGLAIADESGIPSGKAELADLNFVAMWEINGDISVTGKGVPRYSVSGKEYIDTENDGVDAANSTDYWFKGDVTLTPALNNDTVTAPDRFFLKVNGGEEKQYAETDTYPTPENSAKSTVVTFTRAEQDKTVTVDSKEIKCIYTTAVNTKPAFTIQQDTQAPVIKKVEIKEIGEFNLNSETFFYNGFITVTVTATDAANNLSGSGVKDIVLVRKDKDGNPLKEYSALTTDDDGYTVTVTSGDDGSVTAEFVLPKKEDDLKTVALSGNYSIYLKDNLDNTSSETVLKDLKKDEDNFFDTSYIMLEAIKPQITCDYQNVSFKDGDGNYWILDGKSINLHMDDLAIDEENNSGLEIVSVKLNGEDLYSAETKKYVTTDDRFKKELDIPYDALKSGKNTLSVSIEDYAGNTAEDSYEFYSDTAAPTSELIAGSSKVTDDTKFEDSSDIYEDAKGNHWLKKNKDLTLNVYDDAEDYDPSKMVNAGLAEVVYSVTANGTKEEAKSKTETFGSGTYNFSVTFKYADLTPGKNVITVTAKDNVGNTLAETSYTIYVDKELPLADKLTAESEGTMHIRTSGLYTNTDLSLKLAVSDAEFTSGIKSAQLVYTYTKKEGGQKGEEYAKTQKDVTKAVLTGAQNTELTYSLPLAKLENTNGALSVTLIDNVGNKKTYEAGDLLAGLKDGSNLKSNNITIETVVPVVTDMNITKPVYTESRVKDPNGDPQKWYADNNITFTYKISDENEKPYSGLMKVNIRINGEKLETRTIVKEDPRNTSDSGSFSLNDEECGTFWQNGKNTIRVTVTDDAGNTCDEYMYYVYIDNAGEKGRGNPYVTSFSFSRANGIPDKDAKAANAPVTKTDYGFFFRKDTKVYVTVKDKKASSGIKQVVFLTVSNKGKVSRQVDNINIQANESGNTTGVATFTVKANYKGQIYAWVVDNVGNEQSRGEDLEGRDGKWRRPDGVIVESKQLHASQEPHIKIEAVTAPITYLDGSKNPLYKDDAQVKITVNDKYSGIRSIDYTVEAAYDTGKNFKGDVTVDNKGKRTDSSWKVGGKDLNLVTELSKTITVTNNSNDIKVTVHMVDNSGNESKEEFILSIDRDAPIITVSYSPADEGDDPTWTGYFKTDRTMTVTIRERNFDPKRVTFNATKDGSGLGIGSGFGAGKMVSDKGIQYYEYTLKYTYTAEDSDFTFGMSAIDKANNETKDEQVNYGSASAKEVAKKFTIDHVLPTVDVTYDGQSAQNGYYADTVTANVTVVERNFDPSRYEFSLEVRDSVTGQIVSADADYKWTGDSGNNHYAQIVFDTENRFQILSIKITDKAGNESASYNGPEFSVDQSNPEIFIYTDGTKANELNGTASKGDVTPYIVAHDTNLDFDSVTWKITGYRKEDGYTYPVTPQLIDEKDVRNVSFPNLPAEEGNDDIYTIEVTCLDKAGKTAKASAMFSVNRFGSTFMVDEATKELIDTYYLNQEKDVTIYEVNATPISKHEISVSRDGEAQTLREGTDYEVITKEPVQKRNEDGTYEWESDTRWYENTYIIKAANFAGEGRYLVDVLSEDTNTDENNTMTNESSHHEENLFIDNNDQAEIVGAVAADAENKANAPVAFIIDKTAPSLSMTDVKRQNNEDHLDITISSGDAVKLKSVTVYLDGDAVETYDEKAFEEGAGTATYQLTADEKMRELYVVAVDEAGNEIRYPEAPVEVQVTNNVVALYMENTLAKTLTGVGAAAIAAMIAFLVSRRKKRKNDQMAA